MSNALLLTCWGNGNTDLVFLKMRNVKLIMAQLFLNVGLRCYDQRP